MKKAFSFLLTVPQMLAKGFVFSLMWAWFVVPVFLLPKLSFVQSVGLCEVVDFLLLGVSMTALYPSAKESTLKENPKLDEDDFSIAWQMSRVFVFYPLALGIAYVVSLFMP